jgi:hypothetical protein
MVLSSAKYKRHNNEMEDRQNLAEVLPSTSANSSIIISGNNLVSVSRKLKDFSLFILPLADVFACLLDLNFNQSMLTRLNFWQAYFVLN